MKKKEGKKANGAKDRRNAKTLFSIKKTG